MPLHFYILNKLKIPVADEPCKNTPLLLLILTAYFINNTNFMEEQQCAFIIFIPRELLIYLRYCKMEIY